MSGISLKPEGSLTLGLATAGLTYGIYSISVPNTATMHATQAGDINIEAGRKKAAWTSVALVAAVSLMARDKTIFTLGGLMVIALDWHARHANAVSPENGQLVSDVGYHPAQDVAPPVVQNEPDYS
jgi:proline racemase